MIKYVEENILNSPEYYIIVQQVNCMQRMGKGVAQSIALKYPFVKEQYSRYCNGTMYYITDTKPEPKDLLGHVFIARNERISGRKVACIFGQLNYHRYWEATHVRHTDYDALENGLLQLVASYRGLNLHFAIPYKMGCVNAGGDWNIVYDIIERTLGSVFDVTIYRFESYN